MTFSWTVGPRHCRTTGNGVVQELWAIQTVIAQVVPGSKNSAGRHRLLIKVCASGLECGKISAGLGAHGGLQHRWTTAPAPGPVPTGAIRAERTIV